jgi:uncharacterized membrane protein YqaE (UPF0057 family)
LCLREREKSALAHASYTQESCRQCRDTEMCGHASGTPMVKVLLIILCFFLPFLAVLIKDGPSLKVLWAFLLQLCGHIPGVIYGIYQVVKD